MNKELIFSKFANKNSFFKSARKHDFFKKNYVCKKESKDGYEQERLFFDNLKICLDHKKDMVEITFFAKKSIKNINVEMYFFDPDSNFKIISRKIDITKNTWFSKKYPTKRYEEFKSSGLYRTVYFQMNDNNDYQTEKIHNFLIKRKNLYE